jgi:DNA-binding CsgD family transcriptional regulator
MTRWSTSGLVGRDRELGGALEALTAGHGVVVVGPNGSGRTGLAAAVAHAAEGRGDAPLWVVAGTSLSTVPFGAFGWLLGDDDATTDTATTLGRVVSALRGHGGSALTVLVIDDAHLLDERSADAVMQAVAGRAVAVVATTDGDAPLSPWLARLAGDGFVRMVPLAPLTRSETADVIERLLGGPVAHTTAELVWRWSGGLPGIMYAVVTRGRDAGRFRPIGGRWWWAGPPLVPAEIAGCVDRLLAGTDPAVGMALDVVALGEPLELEVVESLVGEPALVELERQGLIATQACDGASVVHVRTPLIAAQRLDAMTPLRRRRAARELLAAVPPRPTPVDLVRRALWHLDGDVPADPEVLIAASSTLRLTNPEFARRLTDANRRWNSNVQALIAAVDVHIEGGDADDARLVLDEAMRKATSSHEVALVESAEITVRLFAERQPHQARRAIAAARSRRGCDDPDLGSLESLSAVLEARPDVAARHARNVLDAPDADAEARVRAGLVHAASLILSGRTGDGVTAAEQLTIEASRHPVVMPTNLGVLRAVVAFGRLWQTGSAAIPATDPAAARHPAPPHLSSADRSTTPVATPFEWPLMRGIAAHLRGEHDVAVAKLRDAAVLQRGGKGLFEAEASAWLVVALCDAGAATEAASAMAQFPARHLAVIPGLEFWAAGVLACVRRRRHDGAALLRRAVAEARHAGAGLIEARYLVELADRGDGDPSPIPRLDDLGRTLDAPVLQCLCRLAVARLENDPRAIVDEAERLAGFGLGPRAAAVATQARLIARRAHDRASARRAVALVRRLHGEPAAPLARTTDRGPALTRREAEVAGIAAGGFADREIAARLFVSVRTVESHLASAYRKLGVGSRIQLSDALAPLRIAG